MYLNAIDIQKSAVRLYPDGGLRGGFHAFRARFCQLHNDAWVSRMVGVMNGYVLVYLSLRALAVVAR